MVACFLECQTELGSSYNIGGRDKAAARSNNGLNINLQEITKGENECR